ncbi:MAG: DJ-1/PfpI family protein [Magnetococcales bacterium]|nr:DJ-1/PfpI family protein [Magnetococcales bacterium]NGZ06690.1 DJ-1/PfpI family protein [Magnetococcales bacterium]
MKRVLIPLAEGCEELEAVTLIDLLRRGGVDVVTAGLDVGGPVTGSHGIVLVPDTTLDAVASESFDMMVLPGGLPGTTHLDADPRIHALLQRMDKEGKYVAAICAAPSVLANAGLLTGKRATSYPTCMPEALVPTMSYCNDPVVRDERVVTSRGPGTAMDFALTLVEILTGVENRRQVEAALLRP